MKNKFIIILALFFYENASARGWHSYDNTPNWFIKLIMFIIAGFLLIVFLNNPVKTIKALILCAIIPATMIRAVIYIDHTYGFIYALFATLVMWPMMMKVIDLAYAKEK